MTHGVRLVILLAGPSLLSAVTGELATGSQTTGLSVVKVPSIGKV